MINEIRTYTRPDPGATWRFNVKRYDTRPSTPELAILRLVRRTILTASGSATATDMRRSAASSTPAHQHLDVARLYDLPDLP